MSKPKSKLAVGGHDHNNRKTPVTKNQNHKSCELIKSKTTKRKRSNLPECEEFVQAKKKYRESENRLLTLNKNQNHKSCEIIKSKATKRKSENTVECEKIVEKKCRDPEKCKKSAQLDFQKFDTLEDEDGFIEIGDRSLPPKRLDPSKWKKNVQKQLKRELYQELASNSIPDCKHKKGPYQCGEITEIDVSFIRSIFAKHTTTVDQNRYILTQVIVDQVKRHRPRNDSKGKRTVSPSFFLRMMSRKRIRVCKKAFETVLGVGHSRLSRVISFYNKFGEAKHERRGGDHKIAKFGSKRVSVVNFIKKLKARESHYGRNKSCRLYLPHELKSIWNVCRIYNSNHELSSQVKYGFFKRIFRHRFNLAFGTPRTDVCTFCLRYKHLILTEKDSTKKQMFRSVLRSHKLRYKEFYKLLKERKPFVKPMAGDCQQNQAMPKIPDQASYFSRQLNLYNFTIAESISVKETSNYAYTWTEDQAKKGSNAIASAVLHKLNNTDFKEISLARLFFDGCGGQNKNVQMLCMASWWLVNKAPKSVRGIQIVFPVTGHSFLPPDRVFGRVEKDIRKEEEILSPADYHEIIKKHETIVELGKSWKIYDWKKYATERFKTAASLPFQISKTKIFEIRRSDSKTVEIKAEVNYRNFNSKFVPVCKKGMNLASSPALAKEKIIINPEKLNDVSSLLQNRFGVNWRHQERLSYFKNLLNRKVTDKESKMSKDIVEYVDDSVCSCCDEDEATFYL